MKGRGFALSLSGHVSGRKKRKSASPKVHSVYTGSVRLSTGAYSFFPCCFCSATQSCLILCDPMNWSTTGLPIPHHLPKFAQVHVHCIGNATWPSHLPMPSSPSAVSLSQNQGFFQWASSLHQLTKILELHLQHQSFQWVFRVGFP